MVRNLGRSLTRDLTDCGVARSHRLNSFPACTPANTFCDSTWHTSGFILNLVNVSVNAGQNPYAHGVAYEPTSGIPERPLRVRTRPLRFALICRNSAQIRHDAPPRDRRRGRMPTKLQRAGRRFLLRLVYELGPDEAVMTLRSLA